MPAGFNICITLVSSVRSEKGTLGTVLLVVSTALYLNGDLSE